MRYVIKLAMAAALLGGGAGALADEPLPPPARPDKGDLQARKALMQEFKREQRPEPRKLVGTILAVDIAAKTMTIATLDSTNVCAITPETSLAQGHDSAGLKDFKVGERVAAICQQAAGKLNALRIRGIEKEIKTRLADGKKALKPPKSGDKPR